MTDAEKREAARQFHNKWVGKGKEDVWTYEKSQLRESLKKATKKWE